MNKSALLALVFACSTGYIAIEYIKLTTSIEDPKNQKQQVLAESKQANASVEVGTDDAVTADTHEHGHEQSTYNIARIKQKLCSGDPSEHYCSINTELDLTDLLFDESLSAARVEETGIILQGKNYREIMQNIVGINSENIMKSETFNQRAIELAKKIDPRIESSFSCNPNLCLAKIRAYSEKNWHEFQEAFFTGEASGNLFVLPDPNEDQVFRVLVALGDGLPVIKREN